MESPTKSIEDYVVSLSGSETPDNYGIEKRSKRVRIRKQHHDGRINYGAKIFANSDLQLYNMFQSNTKDSAREKKIKQQAIKKENAALVMELKSIGSKIKVNLSAGVAGTEKLFGGIDANNRWKDYFGSLNYKFQSSIHCFVVNESLNSVLYGEAFFATGMFGFYAVDYTQKPPKSLRICIPYLDVVAITKAAKVEVTHSTSLLIKPTKRPAIAPLSSATTKPSVIQIWTIAREVHQFYGFGASYDDIFKILTTSWQSLNPI